MRSARSAVYIGVAFLCLTSCTRPPEPESSSAPVARTQAVPAAASASPASSGPARRGTRSPASAIPVATPSPGPSSAPSAPAAAARHARPAAPVIRYLPPNAAPQILSVNVSETTVHSGDRVWGKVVTSSNVASVEARIGSYAMSLNKVGVGRFMLSYTVAPLPWFVRGTYPMRVIAKNTRGDTVERTIPLSVR